jgi:thiamine biosynthesis lipoprotein
MTHLRASRAVPPAITRAWPLLGTLVEMTVDGLPPAAAHVALERAHAEVERVHRLMSFQDPASELTQLNLRACEEPVPVSAALWEVLQTAQAVARASGGLFDITIASTLMRLGYLPRHPGFGAGPAYGGWEDVQLLDGQRVRYARRLYLDLSGIAKGYAVDRAIAALRHSGASGGLVNAGGDLRCFGAAAQTVHVRHPAAPTQLLPLLALREGAVATSAHYFARREQAGRPLTPLIHPLHRTPVEGDLSVTVLAPSCMLADALTKVVHADAQRALAVLPQFGAEALLLQADPASGGCRVLDTRPQPSRLAREAVPA